LFLFILLIIFTLITLAILAFAIFTSDDEAKGPAYGAFGVGAVIILVLGFFTMTYSQDPGEAVVQRSVSGEVVGTTTEEGFHFKAPWVSTIHYDVRNLLVEYVGEGGANYSGGVAKGPQVTMQVSNGTTANVDLAVRYSISPEAAEEIYKRFGSQENFTTQVIENDIRSVSRNAPVTRDALGFIQEREIVADEIQQALTEEWERYGIIVEAVNLQEIRLPEGVQSSFNEAQEATNREAAAIANQEVARADAETRRIEAEGVADANRILSESLSPEVLQQKYIDALQASGQVYVVPEGSQPIVPVTPQPAN